MIVIALTHTAAIRRGLHSNLNPSEILLAVQRQTWPYSSIKGPKELYMLLCVGASLDEPALPIGLYALDDGKVTGQVPADDPLWELIQQQRFLVARNPVTYSRVDQDVANRCVCGCRQITSAPGTFLSGHNNRYVAKLVNRYFDGNLLAMGRYLDEQFPSNRVE